MLEDVLEHMRGELGADARVVAANRVLKGGLGGFFSKEHYEVIAEIGALTGGDVPDHEQPCDARETRGTPRRSPGPRPPFRSPPRSGTVSAVPACPRRSSTSPRR